MRIEVSRTYTFDEKQIRDFMEHRGYNIEEPDYEFKDILDELENADISELKTYGDYDEIFGHDFEVHYD